MPKKLELSYELITVVFVWIMVVMAGIGPPMNELTQEFKSFAQGYVIQKGPFPFVLDLPLAR